uniref:Uncharacterized protein n=1 Tax=Oryzias sinensis TaxID=183150 RepID=A0A8C7XUJ2_9TELE
MSLQPELILDLRSPVSVFFSLHRLPGCDLSETHWEIVASALKSNPSHLTELHLYDNNVEGLSVKVLCSGLESPNCRLQTLSLNMLSGIPPEGACRKKTTTAAMMLFSC